MSAWQVGQLNSHPPWRAAWTTFTRNGEDFAAYHALTQFASVHAKPWAAQEVKFSAKGPDGKSVGLTVDLVDDACDGPRVGVPAAIWKVVAFAATSAGYVGITYREFRVVVG
ncbi:hypothetical protein [Streptomyces canus]|uniref:hypothetical protein n=1 Tax=Streptomyces canus TaxID=58343 RepID=UPI00324FAEE4